MISRKDFLSIVLGEHNEECETRDTYGLGHFLGLLPYSDRKKKYTKWDYFLQIFLFPPTLVSNTVGLLIKAPFYYISKAVTKCSDYFSQKATDAFDGLVDTHDGHGKLARAAIKTWYAVKFLGAGALLATTYAVRLGMHLVKAILFPEHAYREAKKHHLFLGVLSAAFSTLFYVGLCFIPVVGIPVLALLGPTIAHSVTQFVGAFIKPAAAILQITARAVAAAIFGYSAQKTLRDYFRSTPKPTKAELSELSSDKHTKTAPPAIQAVSSRSSAAKKPFMTSLNVGAIPLIGNLKGLREDTQRYREIARHFAEKGSPVICIQEAFSPLCTAIIRNELRRLGYEFIHDSGVGNTSGLMICVKTKAGSSSEDKSAPTYKILATKSEAFDKSYAHCAEELLGHKGFKAVKIEVAPGKFITVVNTHFLSRTSAQEKDALIKDTMKTLTDWAVQPPGEGLTHCGTFYVGDYNLKHKNGLEIKEDAKAAPSDTLRIISGLELTHGRKDNGEEEPKLFMPAMREMQIKHHAQYIVPKNVRQLKASSLKKAAIEELQTANNGAGEWAHSKDQSKEGVVDALWFFPSKSPQQDIRVSTKIVNPEDMVVTRKRVTKSLLSDHMELDVLVDFNPTPAA